MRTPVSRLVLFGAFVLASLVGVVVFLAAGKLALYLDPAAKDSHLTNFIVAILGVAAAVASAFPLFARGVPWALARLERHRESSAIAPRFP